MDDKSWDDYIRETPGTIHGDEARRARERMQGNFENNNVSGIRAGGYDSTAPRGGSSDAGGKIALALLYTLAILPVAIPQFKLPWSWAGFLGLWAGLSIVQFIWPIVTRIMGYILGLAMLGVLAVFIYWVAVA